MTDSQPLTADCYSAGERVWMLRTQQWRGWALDPLLRLLADWRITPNQLTLLSLVAGLAFCPLVAWSLPAALIALAVHLALDGLDGPLARHTGVASRRGSFTDTMADQIVVVATTVCLMKEHTIGVLPGGVYIFLYTVVVVFSMVRNALAIPYSWLIRPRMIVYGWIAIEWYLLPGSIDDVLWLFNAMLAVKTLSGFSRIRSRI